MTDQQSVSLRRDGAKAAARFHEAWVRMLLTKSVRTLRRTCIELAALEEANRGFRDGRLFEFLRKNLEFCIRDIGGPRCRWSVARARRNRRGRPKRKSHINAELQRALTKRLTPTLDED